MLDLASPALRGRALVGQPGGTARPRFGQTAPHPDGGGRDRLRVDPWPGGVINGCYAKSVGSLRVIDSSASRKSNETALNWSQTGLKGATGAKGPTGRGGPTGRAEVVRVGVLEELVGDAGEDDLGFEDEESFEVEGALVVE